VPFISPDKRFLRGIDAQRQANTRLTAQDVLHIRQLAETGYQVRQIAQAYGVGMETIRRIVRRDTWDWLSDQLPTPLPPIVPPTRPEPLPPLQKRELPPPLPPLERRPEPAPLPPIVLPERTLTPQEVAHTARAEALAAEAQASLERLIAEGVVKPEDTSKECGEK
jgi:hypothetical protein